MDINAIIDEMMEMKETGDRMQPFYNDVNIESVGKIADRFGENNAAPFVAGMAIVLEYVSRHRCDYCKCECT
jgi:hypothetical protein